MRTMMIYLAGPIDDVSGEEARGWRQHLADVAPTGVLFFNPATAWGNAGPATAQALDYGNVHVLQRCDGLLANLMGPGRGFGTTMETERARIMGKPVAIAQGDFPIVSLCAHNFILKETVEEAFDALIDAIRQQQDAVPTFPFPGVILGHEQEGDEE